MNARVRRRVIGGARPAAVGRGRGAPGGRRSHDALGCGAARARIDVTWLDGASRSEYAQALVTRSRLRQRLDALLRDFADAVVRTVLDAVRDGSGREVRSAARPIATPAAQRRRSPRARPASTAADARTSEARTNEARTHEARTNVARTHEARTNEARTNEARTNEARRSLAPVRAVDAAAPTRKSVVPPPPPPRAPAATGEGSVRERLVALVEAHPRGATGVPASELAFRSGLPEARVVEALAAAVVAGRVRRRGALYMRALKRARRAAPPPSAPRIVDVEPASPDAITDPTALLAAMEPAPAPPPIAAPPSPASSPSPTTTAAAAPALRPGEKVLRTTAGGAVVVRRRSGG